MLYSAIDSIVTLIFLEFDVVNEAITHGQEEHPIHYPLWICGEYAVILYLDFIVSCCRCYENLCSRFCPYYRTLLTVRLQLGVGSYVAHYFSTVVNSILVNFGLSEEMHYPVSYIPLMFNLILDNHCKNVLLLLPEGKNDGWLFCSLYLYTIKLAF